MKKIITLLLLGVVYFSCEKKESTQPDTTTVGTTAIVPTSHLLYNGFFPLEQYNQWVNGVNVSFPAQYATKFTLFTNAVNETRQFIGTSNNLGTVLVNGRQLKYNTILNMYTDTTLGSNYSQQRLITLNSNALPSFTTTVQDTFPVYTSTNAIQINDTLFLNTDFVVPLTNITYYDVIECTISPNPANGTQIVYKKITSQANQIIFRASELSTYTSGQQVYCRLNLKKFIIKQIGGKNFRFELCSFNDFYMLTQ